MCSYFKWNPTQIQAAIILRVIPTWLLVNDLNPGVSVVCLVWSSRWGQSSERVVDDRRFDYLFRVKWEVFVRWWYLCLWSCFWLVSSDNALYIFLHEGVMQSNQLTTSKKNKGWSKFGFFCVFLMTVECTTWPPHSNSMLGEDTLASWNFFIFRTPQHRTCERAKTIHHEHRDQDATDTQILLHTIRDIKMEQICQESHWGRY